MAIFLQVLISISFLFQDLPPPVDEAKFFKPNLRKKQMELHFKTVPQDQRSVPPPPPPPPPPPQPIPQEQELPVGCCDKLNILKYLILDEESMKKRWQISYCFS